MIKILKDYEGVEVDRIDEYYPIDKELKCSPMQAINFVEQDMTNGDILGIPKYAIDDGVLVAVGYRFKFFDSHAARLNKKRFVPRASVNAVIRTLDDKMVMIRRGWKDSCYRGYWDFPAGMLPFDVSLLDRLKNRIRKDTLLEEGNLEIDEKPSFVAIRDRPGDNSFQLYYDVKVDMNSKDLREFFDDMFRHGKPIVFPARDAGRFLEQNWRRIYPREAMEELAR